MRTLLSILFVLCTLPIFSSPLEGREGTIYHFAYNLRTQYRYVDVRFVESGDTLYYHWSRKTDEGVRQGAFAMSRKSRDHATQICYVMPTRDKTVVTPDNELFAFVSRDAYNALKNDGKCRFNNTTLTLLDAKDGMLHVRDYDEGYEMWIEDNPDFPLIHKMQNNPVEIDWEVMMN